MNWLLLALFCNRFLFNTSDSGNWIRFSWLFDTNFVNLNPDYLSIEKAILVNLVKCSTELFDFKKLPT